jgi:DNA-binding NarL/FixJ family response regulator
VKAYRQRKAKAQRLRAKGKTLRQIAAELESTTDTVKEWLKPIDGRKNGPSR